MAVLLEEARHAGAGCLSPLAIAFLVGYAADVFFFFLDGLLQTFTRARADTPAPAAVTVKPAPAKT